MDMLVKLYDLPDSRAAFERLRGHHIQIRRALVPEKQQRHRLGAGEFFARMVKRD